MGCMMSRVAVPHPGNAQLVWLKLIKVCYKFTILCTLHSVINIRYNVLICILKQKPLPVGNNYCHKYYVTNISIRGYLLTGIHVRGSSCNGICICIRICGASRAGICIRIHIRGYANFDFRSISRMHTVIWNSL